MEGNTEFIIKPRKINSQNIVDRLIYRETFAYHKPGTHFHVTRQFYQNVFPNFTVMNVVKPPCFLRKFSPDGKYFIAFSADQTSVEIYVYQGPRAAGDLLEKVTFGEYVPNTQDTVNYEIRSQIFDKFFKVRIKLLMPVLLSLLPDSVCFIQEIPFLQLKFSISVSRSNEQLNRECSLFTDDSKYVIVGSAGHIPDDLRPHFYQVYTSNEAVTPNPR